MPGKVYEVDAEMEALNIRTGEKKWIQYRCWMVPTGVAGEWRIDGTMTDMTARKQAEMEISDQRKMLRDLIDNLPLMIMLIDKKGVIQFINKHLVNLSFSEANPEDFVGLPYSEYTKRTLRNEADIAWNKEFMQTENVWVEIHAPLPDGGTYYSSWMGVPTENGGRIHLGQDVNNTKKLEADLRQQREMLQAIVDNLPQYLLATDNQNRYRFFGKSYVKLYERFTKGRDVYQDVLGIDEKEFMTNAYKPQGEDVLTTAMHYLTTQSEPVEMPYKSADGEMIYILWYRIALPDGGFLNVGQDVTPRKKLMADLEKQRRMLQTLIENLPLKILMVDEAEHIKFINQNFMLSNTKDFVERPLEDFVNATFRDVNEQRRALNILRTSLSWTDHAQLTLTGEEQINSWLTIPLTKRSYITIGQDVTQRRKAEDEKARLLEQLITQNNDFLQFSYIASHNLRGPVASILGLINLLEYNPSVDGYKEVLKRIQDSINSLDVVITDMNQILEFRNVEAHQNQKIYMEQLVVLVVESFRAQLDECDIKVSIDIRVTWVYTIQSYLHSILHNLISNAIKYRENNRKSFIHIEANVIEDEIHIMVKDNGKGIDLERFKDKLFLLYQRFDLDVTGKGLGLFMAKTQAESIGGVIQAHSERGVGSSFTLIIPATDKVPALDRH